MATSFLFVWVDEIAAEIFYGGTRMFVPALVASAGEQGDERYGSE